MCNGMMKSRSFKLPLHVPRDRQFRQRAVLAVRIPRQYVQKLRCPVFDRRLDVVPESFAAEKLREIAPHRVALPRQLKGEPTGDKIVLGIRVAEKQHVPAWPMTGFSDLSMRLAPPPQHLLVTASLWLGKFSDQFKTLHFAHICHKSITRRCAVRRPLALRKLRARAHPPTRLTRPASPLRRRSQWWRSLR